MKRIEYRMHAVLWDVANRYTNDFPNFTPIAHENIILLRYNVGQRYSIHTDQLRGLDRSLTVIMGLNNDYEGGEIAFFNGTLTMRVGRGDAIAFPSNFMYPHEVCPITKGVRYSAVCWF